MTTIHLIILLIGLYTIGCTLSFMIYCIMDHDDKEFKFGYYEIISIFWSWITILYFIHKYKKSYY